MHFAAYCVCTDATIREKVRRELIGAARLLPTHRSGQGSVQDAPAGRVADHDWDERAMLARLRVPDVLRFRPELHDCGRTGLLTEEREKPPNIEALAKLTYEEHEREEPPPPRIFSIDHA